MLVHVSGTNTAPGHHFSKPYFPKLSLNHSLCRLVDLVLILTTQIRACHSEKCPKSDQRVTEVKLIFIYVDHAFY